MNYLNKVEQWYEPTDLLRKTSDFVCEMSREDHGFLCGIIKQIRPKKILEVGVAEGGTTAVIVKSLEILGLNCDMFSVDLYEQLWHDKRLETGYIYKKQKKTEDINHRFLFGKTVAGRLSQIGGEIDLVILDTTHQMPGEVLDFLSVLPFLSKDCMVVLHDLNLSYLKAQTASLSSIRSAMGIIATKVVYTTVVAEKYYNFDAEHLFNIAAFKVTEDTRKFSMDLFISLSFVWGYNLDDIVLQEYRNLFEQYYPPQCLEMFDVCVKMNRSVWEKVKISSIDATECSIYRFPYEDIPYGCKIVLYGAGYVGRAISLMLKALNYAEVVAWVDTNYMECQKGGNVAVENPGSILNKEFDFILVAVKSKEIFNEIKQFILENNLNKGKPIVGPIE